MADVRTFRAATMRDALDLVRDELGADAVILHTRQVARRRLLPWSKPIEEVEITATLTLNVGTAPERKPTKRTPPAVSPKAEPTSERPRHDRPSAEARPRNGRRAGDSIWFRNRKKRLPKSWAGSGHRPPRGAPRARNRLKATSKCPNLRGAPSSKNRPSL